MSNTLTPPTTPPTRLDQRLDWARLTLEVAPDAAWQDVQARMLRLVTDEEFVPPEGAVQAFRTLQSDALGVAELDDPPAFVRQHEGELQAEAGRFALGMFRLPVAERQSKWHKLMARAQHAPRARAWLERLSAGLAVDLGLLNTKPEPTQQMARHLAELFVLPPIAKAVRRTELVSRLIETRTQWETAVRQIQQQHADIAALDPMLLQQLLTPPTPAGTGPRIQLPTTRPPANSSSDSRIIWILIVVGLLVASRLPGLMSGSSSRPNTPPRSTNSQPFNRPDANEVIRKLRERSRSNLPPLLPPSSTEDRGQ